jgi:DNA-directed RNA polymerase subunit RPC12/RpoP/desulfoferrodoxin (superoxide reductase-like protein)
MKGLDDKAIEKARKDMVQTLARVEKLTEELVKESKHVPIIVARLREEDGNLVPTVHVGGEIHSVNVAFLSWLKDAMVETVIGITLPADEEEEDESDEVLAELLDTPGMVSCSGCGSIINATEAEVPILHVPNQIEAGTYVNCPICHCKILLQDEDAEAVFEAIKEREKASK